MEYKQLQLPLLCMQLINAMNDTEIISSVKKKTFDRSQIVPLTFARILVVDDNTTNIQVAQGLIAPYKMNIDVATSGFKAIELVKIIKYDDALEEKQQTLLACCAGFEYERLEELIQGL